MVRVRARNDGCLKGEISPNERLKAANERLAPLRSQLWRSFWLALLTMFFLAGLCVGTIHWGYSENDQAFAVLLVTAFLFQTFFKLGKTIHLSNPIEKEIERLKSLVRYEQYN